MRAILKLEIVDIDALDEMAIPRFHLCTYGQSISLSSRTAPSTVRPEEPVPPPHRLGSPPRHQLPHRQPMIDLLHAPWTEALR